MRDETGGILDRVRETAHQRIVFLLHAVHQMNAPEQMITPQEIRAVVLHGAVIEDYPEDARGHSCLMLGAGDDARPIHVVCAPKDGYLTIITAYPPSPDQWEPGWKKRKET